MSWSKTVERGTSILSQLIAIGGALLAVAAVLGGWIDERLDEKIAASIERQFEDSESRLAQLSTLTEELASRDEPGFGAWERVDPNEVYEAEADGFLTVFTLSARVALDTGTERAAATMGTRTRVPPHDGSMTPVKKGHYYKVRVDSGDLNQVTAYWIPAR